MDAVLTTKSDLQLEIVGNLVATVLSLTSLDGQVRKDLVTRNIDGDGQISKLSINLVTRFGINSFVKVSASKPLLASY